MKRKVWFWIGGVALLIAVSVEISLHIAASRDAAALQEQLRLAWAEGLPTNWQQFKSTIRPAAPSENAAPYYRELARLVRHKTSPQLIDRAITFHADVKNRAQAQALLKQMGNALETIDKAAALPRCWFDRDWSRGAAVPMPEYADMKAAVHWVALRGSLDVAEGHADRAIGSAREILTVARHVGEEPTAIAQVVRESIYFTALDLLAYWTFMHPKEPAYLDAFNKAFSQFPQLNLKVEHRDNLLSLLWLVEKGVTPEGRRDLGIKDEDVPAGSCPRSGGNLSRRMLLS